MNTPASRDGNLIRYIFYVIGYLMAVGAYKLATKNAPGHVWDLVLFATISLMVILFYVYRFNREQRYFDRSFTGSWLNYFGTIVALTVVVTALRISVSWMQAYSRLSLYGFQVAFLRHESDSGYWFLLLAVGVVLPVLQEFLATGFLFNYAFRRSTLTTAFWGMLASGILFSLLNCQGSVVLLAIDVLFGALFAWSYLYAQTLWMPVYLAVLNGVLLVIMT